MNSFTDKLQALRKLEKDVLIALEDTGTQDAHRKKLKYTGGKSDNNALSQLTGSQPDFLNNHPPKTSASAPKLLGKFQNSVSKNVNKASATSYNLNNVNNNGLDGNRDLRGKKNPKINSIKQLFSNSPKFIKHCKRGIFLSCVIYCDDKLLVTGEENLPTLEIDDAYPSSLHNDFLWLLKVSTTWENVKSFKTDIEKCSSASTYHFRLKMLQTCAAMQSALGITDLGRLYHRPIFSEDNFVVVITTITYLRSTKMISCLGLRWISMSAEVNTRKREDSSNIFDTVVKSLPDQVLYHQVSNMPVGKGLYLGYLMLATSVDALKIVVAGKSPNMIPHVKLRDNPILSKEEQTFIHTLGPNSSTSFDHDGNFPPRNNFQNSESKSTNSCDKCLSPQQQQQQDLVTGTRRDSKLQTSKVPTTPKNKCTHVNTLPLFRRLMIAGLERLFTFLEVDDQAVKIHRLYHTKIIEINSSVSLLIVVPPVDKMCVPLGQSHPLMRRKDLISLPVQIFEMIHMSAYHSDLISCYSRLSAILEVKTVVAQHCQREAFSESEIAEAKKQLSLVEKFQSRLDSTWKDYRWVISVITNSRDKSFPMVSIKSALESCATWSMIIPTNPNNNNNSPQATNKTTPILNKSPLKLPRSAAAPSPEYIPSTISNPEFSVSFMADYENPHPNSNSKLQNNIGLHFSKSSTKGALEAGRKYLRHDHLHNLTPQNSRSSVLSSNLEAELMHSSSLFNLRNPTANGTAATTKSTNQRGFYIRPETSSSASAISLGNFNFHRRSQSPPSSQLLPNSRLDCRVSHDPPQYFPSVSSSASTTNVPMATTRKISDSLFSDFNNENNGPTETSQINVSSPSSSSFSSNYLVPGHHGFLTPKKINFSSADSLASLSPKSMNYSTSETISLSPHILHSSSSEIPGINSISSAISPKNFNFQEIPGINSMSSSGISPKNINFQEISGTVGHENINFPSTSSSQMKSPQIMNFPTSEEPSTIISSPEFFQRIPANLSSSLSSPRLQEIDQSMEEKLPSSKVIQVYAAYDCGLIAGTCVKMQITPSTTARQVVELLVKQLNDRVRAKGLDKPLYDSPLEFCLVSVVGGARERCLRNDFNPLLLQSPWNGGVLYVRKRKEVTAALEMNTR